MQTYHCICVVQLSIDFVKKNKFEKIVNDVKLGNITPVKQLSDFSYKKVQVQAPWKSETAGSVFFEVEFKFKSTYELQEKDQEQQALQWLYPLSQHLMKFYTDAELNTVVAASTVCSVFNVTPQAENNQPSF